MGPTNHIAVIGAGTFGSWTAYFLRKKGFRVTLLDAWGPGHSRASSGGETRVIRSVYGTDAIYTRLVADAYRLWESFDKEWNTHLYHRTGNLWLFSVPDDGYARKAVPVIRSEGLHIEEWSIEATRKKYPQINYDDVHSVFFEKEAGYLYARNACREVTQAFKSLGGTYLNCAVLSIESTQGKIQKLQLSDGTSITADQYVFACGPWLPKLFPETLGEHLKVTKQEILYFGTPPGNDFSPPNFPVWIDYGEELYYGIPNAGNRGFKIGDDNRGASIDPDSLDRTLTEASIQKARQFLTKRFPKLANAPLIEYRICQYTSTLDGHYLIDRHPEFSNTWLAGAGCGHGFKIGPAIGQYLSKLIVNEQDAHSAFLYARLVDIDGELTQFERN